MSDLQAKLMGAAMVGAFTVAGSYVVEELEKRNIFPDQKNKMIQMFLIGASGSLLQQYILPALQ
jgi:hypothetical protein